MRADPLFPMIENQMSGIISITKAYVPKYAKSHCSRSFIYSLAASAFSPLSVSEFDKPASRFVHCVHTLHSLNVYGVAAAPRWYQCDTMSLF